MKRNSNFKHIFAFFSTVFIMINIFSSTLISGYIINSEKNTTAASYENSYIIRFKQDSLSSYRDKLKNSIFSDLSEKNLKNLIDEKVLEYKESLLNLHSRAEKDILNILGDAFKSQQIFTKRFTSLFNGIVVKNIPSDKVSLIGSLSYVESITPDRKLKVFLDDSVPLINADDVWELHDKQGSDLTGEGINIAIVDTGIDYNHPDIKDNYVGGYDFVNNDNDPMDDNGHGTTCAGIAVGVAPKVNLYSFKILNETGGGYGSDLQAAIDYALDPNNDGDYSDRFIDILSMSFGDPKINESITPDEYLCKEIDNATITGLIFVIAAGNSGPGYKTINWPGIARKSICVGASDKNDNIASFSSRGPVEWNGNVMIKPDVVAPGVGIKSTKSGGGYISMSGTSMATPHVAGAAALLLQAHPDWTPEMVKNALKENAVDLGYDENTQGAGRIDVLASVNLSSAPPVAILNVSEYLQKGIITINGTAMNGTGNSSDFVNYSLYYRFDQEWIKLTEKNSEVKNSVLYTWDATNLESGYYELKLFVNSIDQASVAIKEVNIGYSGLIVEYNKTVFENEEFNVKIFNSDFEPVSAFVVFTSPFHIPHIKYGSNVSFKAPNIFNPFSQNLTGKIIVIKINGLQKNVGIITINKK
jgi:subtilisin family serine protease